MTRLASLVTLAALALGAAACGSVGSRAEGEGCAATTQCEAGLVCDFGQTPAVCSGQGSGGPPPEDGGPAIVVDAAPGAIDAAPVDAAPVDAAPPDAPPADAGV